MITKDHSQLTDDEYESQFSRCTFKPRLFSHEAHLRLAYIHIKKYGAQKAEANMKEQIKAYAKYYGVASKYREDITITAVRIVSEILETAQAKSFKELLLAEPALLSSWKVLIAERSKKLKS